MSKFCPQCGAENNDDLIHCANCGYCYPQTKEQGKGFGVASLIFGIFSIFCSLSLTINLITFLFGKGSIVIATPIFEMLFSILAIIFAIVANKKGYKNKISKAGLIMGIIGLVIGLISLIVSIQII